MNICKRFVEAFVILCILFVFVLCTNDKTIGIIEESEIVETELVEEDANTLNWENVDVVIPGLQNEYTFAFVCDMHMVTDSDEVSEENKETIISRKALFSTATWETSSEIWPRMAENISKEEFDGVLFGGDMLDFVSSSNISVLKAGMDKIEAPIMYVRADHDYGTWYGSLGEEDVNRLHSEVISQESVYVMEYDEICVVGIDNNTSQLSNEGLEKAKQVFSLGKPIVLVTHVPINSRIDESLAQQSRISWQDRALVWGEGCYYEPDENTRELLNMIYADDSPVKMILSGHLHFAWDGNVTENTRQHVFIPSFTNTVGIIRIHG